MTIEALVDALALPGSARVSLRVAKRMLTDRTAVTAADKRHIRDDLKELHWIASLKPSTVGIPATAESGVSEIAVLVGMLRGDAKTDRLEELIHRGIPYAVLLILERQGNLRMSAARKRASLAATEGVVLVGDVAGVWLDEQMDDQVEQDFLKALPLAAQPSTDLSSVYLGWFDALLGKNAALVTGQFRRLTSPDAIIERQAALAKCVKLEREIVELRSAADGERQLARRVDLNLTLKRVQAEYKVLSDQL
jgi:hypothetical protein